MAYSNEPLGDSLLTEAAMMEDLDSLRACYKAMDIAAQIFPGEEGEAPTLAALVPLDEPESYQTVTNTFLPLSSEEAEFTKYLQFYAQLERDLSGVDQLALLESVSRLNEFLPLGTCFTLQKDDGRRCLALRYVQGFRLYEPIHPGVFTEDALLFETSWDLADTMAKALAEGKTVDEALAFLKQE